MDDQVLNLSKQNRNSEFIFQFLDKISARIFFVLSVIVGSRRSDNFLGDYSMTIHDSIQHFLIRKSDMQLTYCGWLKNFLSTSIYKDVGTVRKFFGLNHSSDDTMVWCGLQNSSSLHPQCDDLATWTIQYDKFKDTLSSTLMLPPPAVHLKVVFTRNKMPPQAFVNALDHVKLSLSAGDAICDIIGPTESSSHGGAVPSKTLCSATG